jgi:HAE1 family hydrophobic/amphiphilic exporter-1
MVSLLVSFTLTPMMSARFMHVEEMKHGPVSRKGFYAWIERWYLRILGFAMRHRLSVGIFATLIVLTSIPLFKMSRIEYTPSNVDEGEFEVNVIAPEGTSLTAMIPTLDVLEEELRRVPGVKNILASVGGGGPSGSVNYGRFYVQMPPHVERTLSVGKFWQSLKSGNPLATFKNNYSQRDVMQEVRARMRNYKEVRVQVNNSQSFSIGGRRWEIDYAILGPELETLGKIGDELRRRAPEIGIIDADTTLKLDKPELRVVIDRERAANMGVDSEDIATALRIMVGGEERVSRFRDPHPNSPRARDRSPRAIPAYPASKSCPHQ